MAYLGNDLQVAFPVYRNIDDISGSFNSVLTTFPLTVSGVAPIPAPLYSQQCLISVGGVVQRPDDSGTEGFRLSGSNIIFASAPTTGADFFGVILAGADYINAGANFPSGSAAVPSITFDSDLDTGIYNSGANQVSITTSGTERLRIDSAGQIESVSLGTAAAPAFSFTTDPNTGIYSPGADQVAISTNGTGRLIVDASGRVGIGGSPTDALFVTGSVANFNVRSTSSSAATSFKWGNDLDTKSTEMWVNGSAVSTFGGASAFNVYQAAAAPILVSTNGSERLRITSAGLVGVGTSSPSARLHVSSADASATYLRVENTGGYALFGVDASGNAYAGAETNDAFGLVTNGSYRMYITAGGNVGIGTSSPAQRLHVSGSNAGGFQVTNADNSDAISLFVRGGNPINSTTDNAVLHVGQRSDVSIITTGRVGIGSSTPQNLLHLNASGDTVLQLTNGTTGTTTTDGSAVIVEDPSMDLVLKNRENAAIRFQTNNTDRGRFDASGRLLIGTSTTATVGDSQYAKFQVRGNTISDTGILSIQRASAASSSGNAIGSIFFTDNSGNDYASITVAADATPGSGDYPGRLVFSTTADGASSPTERMRIAQNGVITIQNGAVAVIGTLTDGATITPDFAADCNFTVTLGGNRTIANPTNITAGQSGSIFIVQDGTGSRTLSWGSYWDFPGGTAPTLSTAANAVDRIDYIVRSSTSIHTVFTANYS